METNLSHENSLKAEAVEDCGSKLPSSISAAANMPTGSNTSKGTSNSSLGTGSTIGVGDFVEASFASFEKTYRFNATAPSSTAGGSQIHSSNTHHDSVDKDSTSHNSSTGLPLLYSTFLYSFLPFLFFCARRSMFGVASILRSFLIGHALRLFMTFFPGFSLSKSSSSVPLPIFIKDKVSSVLLSTGTNTWGNSGSSNHNNNNNLINDWVQHWQVVIVGKLGGGSTFVSASVFSNTGSSHSLFFVGPSRWIDLGALGEANVSTFLLLINLSQM